jgi:2-polyprenyl-3-methyl-5-hydroxy-6-metoxy-1,4-benzoquinol methylase
MVDTCSPMTLPGALCCLMHQDELVADGGGRQVKATTRALRCPRGCEIPVQRGIPRFVDSRNYAAAFGRQWNTFRRAQLDSFGGQPISRDRLERSLGGSLGVVKGRTVLEAGCGAGRFTEQLLGAGAHVFACDMSTAVEANRENCAASDNYFVCQADLLQLQVRRGSFDIVVCLGVIQHTPDPEETIARLATYVTPGGLLVIDHYRYGVEDMTHVRQRLRRVLLRMPSLWALSLVRAMVAVLWPVHRMLWRHRHRPWVAKCRARWLRVSPVLDYQDTYGALGRNLLYAWAALDTHDALTDVYKHKRTVEQVARALQVCGLEGIEVSYGGNGVEARARKPNRGTGDVSSSRS